MSWIAALLWISLACIAYTYFIYPLLLVVIGSVHQLRSDWRLVSRGGSRRVADPRELPRVAVLVAAFNEERHVAERVRNILEQAYPADRLRILIGSDASSDDTDRILGALASDRLTFVPFEQRRGKASVINDLAAMADEEILVFSDANTLFRQDTVARLVRHFDKSEVGCVCGELRLVSPEGGGENQDHIYWRYERLLKYFESRIGALLGANGGVYALRRCDYAPIPPDTIVDDFWISMQVVERGYRCVYDPEAVATEGTPERIGDEFRRRVRIGMGNYQAFRRFGGLLDPRRGMLAFTFVSHKCLRWLAPHFMVLALLCNLLLAGQGAYAALLAGQVVFYGSAWFAWLRARTGVAPRPLRIPLFFVSMNLALLIGSWKFVTARSSGVWARSAR